MLKHPQLTETRILNGLSRVQSLVYRAKEPIDLAAWVVGGEPVDPKTAFRAEYRPFSVGGKWGALWDTTWFRFRGIVPREWKGERVVVLTRLTLNSLREGFTAEGLVYQYGIPTIALNANRQEVEISAEAKGGEKFEFYIEAAANGGSNEAGVTDGLNNPEYHGKPRYILEQAELAVFDPEAYRFYMDYRAASEAMVALSADSQRRGELVYALNECLNILDMANRETISPARKALNTVMLRKNGDTVHQLSAVGHAHIDTAWLWPLRETIRKCARTFSTALAYMERYPEYVFVCSQAQQYAWMKVYYPTIWEGIKKAVKRGQWEPVGSMWIEADCNLASGESLIRQILHGKRFFSEELGYETRDVWIPDVFGYAASLPQIMKGAGVEYFLTQKISWNQFNKFPHHTFEWEGIDGTRIFTHFPPADTYNAEVTGEELIRNVKNFREHGRSTRSLLVYGFGDGGGGPTLEMLEKARRFRDFDGLPKIEPEKALAFFEKASTEARDLPVWVGELYLELHRGTYTTQAKNKLGNRKSEFLLRDAEFLDAITMTLAPRRKETAVDPERAVYDVTGLSRKNSHLHRAALDRAWKLVLLNQFHDIIPGSSINWVYQDSAKDYETIRQLGESVKESAAKTLDALIDTSAFRNPVILTNTLSMPRREVVELSDGRFTIVEVPSLGYTVVEQRDSTAPRTPVKVKASRGGFVLENGLLRIYIDRQGRLTSVFDLEAHREALSGIGNELRLHEDIPNNWDAWDVDVFYREKTQVIGGLLSLELVEDTPWRASVRIVREFGYSRLEQRIVLSAESRRIDFPTHVSWNESQKLLKVAFPVDIRAMNARYEIQYGNVERPTHTNTSWDVARFEVCAQKWADLSEPGYGVALLNDCKYGHDILGNVMALSLLRSSISPDPLADRGEHDFTYSLLPHLGDFREGRVIEEAYALNVPLLTRPLKSTSGKLPATQAFFEIDRPGIVIEAVKVSEDGRSVVVRLYEAFGGRGNARLKTSLAASQVWRADLLESKQNSLPLIEGVVELQFRPFEIATLRYEVA